MNPVFLKTLQAMLLVVLLHLHLQLIGSDSRRAAGAGVRCIDMERQALLEFKAGFSDNGGLLSSWGSKDQKRDCCEWEGVGCSNLTGHVGMLDLNFDVSYYSDKFAGKIPIELASLSHLQYLNLSNNKLQGTIPHQLWKLMQLQNLDLSGNQLVGRIPYELGHVSQLQNLDLSGNKLVGRIPFQLGNFASLQKLNLGRNHGLEIGQRLPNLTSIAYLDLSRVMNLNHSHTWLQMIGMLPNLRELHIEQCYLSNAHLLSLVPLKFKFPASLTLLDLSFNFLTSSIFPWLFKVSSSLVELELAHNLLEGPLSYDFFKMMNSLERIDLSYNRLNSNFLKSFKNINLLSLDLSGNNLNEDLPTILHSLHGVRHSLQELYLRQNQITGTLADLSAFPCLTTLELSYNQLQGNIPESIRFPSQFESLEIGSNSLQSGIPQSFGNICTLHTVDLSNNSLSEEFLVIIHNLSGCARYSLQNLLLDNNKISGALLDLSLFSSLKTLWLSHNRLNGKIADDIRFPSQLDSLDLSFNSLECVVVSDSTFANLSRLHLLDLSYNSLALTFSRNWVPLFQLGGIYLAACKIGPEFPEWIQTQHNLLALDISNAVIKAVVPDWFWNLQLRLILLNISYNNVKGTIPNLPLGNITLGLITLASNQFEGSIPPFLRSAIKLNVSNNKFSQSLTFLCHNSAVDSLGILDLSKNQISGQLPDCWSHFKSLIYLDLSGNNISGELPKSLEYLSQLQVLIVRSNKLTGELPLSLKNCSELQMLDVGENRFSGLIPSWIGSDLQQLKILSLRRNQFSGSLLSQLCYLTSIQVLDLSFNSLAGHILKCFKNLTSMFQNKISPEEVARIRYYFYPLSLDTGYGIYYHLIAWLMWKGVERNFKDNNLILNIIDLSSNQLSGQIPKEIGNLVELVSFNLSTNNLTGQIPSEIGWLRSLDILDLSRNQFFGRIPSSLAHIDHLAVLDLSNNHLPGKIPTGTQLQSFRASTYEGNADLCGEPLEKKCPDSDEALEPAELPEDEYSIFSRGFYVSMVLGFITGFWGIFGSLIISRSWRHAYFRFLSNLMDRIYVIIAVNIYGNSSIRAYHCHNYCSPAA